MKNKDASTISDSEYNESDKHVDTISDSSKQVDAITEPIKDTHIVDGINNLSVGVISVEPAVIVIRIIRQGSNQIITNNNTSIGTNLVTNVLKNSSEKLFTYALTSSSEELFNTNFS